MGLKKTLSGFAQICFNLFLFVCFVVSFVYSLNLDSQDTSYFMEKTTFFVIFPKP